MNVNQIDVFDTQTLHALIDALLYPLPTIVPSVYTILAVATHFGGEDVAVARNLSQRLAQHHFRFVVSVVWRHIN